MPVGKDTEQTCAHMDSRSLLFNTPSYAATVDPGKTAVPVPRGVCLTASVRLGCVLGVRKTAQHPSENDSECEAEPCL